MSEIKRRRHAQLYIMMAERHRSRGDDAGLVAALVRRAWRLHEQEDRRAGVLGVAPTPAGAPLEHARQAKA